jgi:hypothetical protein
MTSSKDRVLGPGGSPYLIRGLRKIELGKGQGLNSGVLPQQRTIPLHDEQHGKRLLHASSGKLNAKKGHSQQGPLSSPLSPMQRGYSGQAQIPKRGRSPFWENSRELEPIPNHQSRLPPTLKTPKRS